jgi:SAM-dependent methyltransferase
MWPATSALLDTVGVSPDARCLDIGCGGGDVTLALAARVPAGSVVGADLDDAKLAVATFEAAEAGVANVVYRDLDALVPPSNADGDRADAFDLIYARFLLTHLPDPAIAVRNLHDRLVPGGVLVVEDIDFTGHFCAPPNVAFSRYVELYTAVVQGRGCDPNIGPRLPTLLTDAGLRLAGVRVAQPAGHVGEVKQIGPITLEAIAASLLDAGLVTIDELNQLVDDLYAFANTEGTVLSLPRIVQTWGRRS